MNTQSQDPELEMTKQLIQAVIDKLHELKGDNEYQSISEGIDVLIDKYTDALRIFELRSKDEKLSYHWKGRRLENWIVTHSNLTHTTSYDKKSNLFNIEEGEYNFITWRGDKAEYIGVGKRYDGYVPASNRHPDLVFEENNEAKRKIGIEAKFFYFTYDGDTDASKEEQIKKAFQSKIDNLNNNKKEGDGKTPELSKVIEHCIEEHISELYYVIAGGWNNCSQSTQGYPEYVCVVPIIYKKAYKEVKIGDIKVEDIFIGKNFQSSNFLKFKGSRIE